MTKKTFKGSNPALQYISSIESDSGDNEHITDNTQETDNKYKTDDKQDMYNTQDTSNKYNTNNTHEVTNKHNAHEIPNKQYTYNTQETYNKQVDDDKHISDNTHYTDNTYNTFSTSNTHKTYNAYIRETKSRRLNLLLQHSLLDNVTKIARMKQTSVNDLINTVLKSYIEQESSVVERYEEVFGKQPIEGS
jgi:hypothetical protein